MAKYDFDEPIPRRGTNSVKWDEEPAADILPMWVADMDFRTAPCVVEALRRRGEQVPLAGPPVLLFDSYDRMENRILCVLFMNKL